MNKKIVIRIIKDTLKIQNKNIDIDKLKIGTYKKWDSLANMQILMELEKQLDIRFSIDELSDLNSTKKILNKLKIK
tara:strand:+ start:305 stop:532 length:228 start_codon:yes stop_codon:yes gene_type:complete